jgi:hypothetical protein
LFLPQPHESFLYGLHSQVPRCRFKVRVPEPNKAHCIPSRKESAISLTLLQSTSNPNVRLHAGLDVTIYSPLPGPVDKYQIHPAIPARNDRAMSRKAARIAVLANRLERALRPFPAPIRGLRIGRTLPYTSTVTANTGEKLFLCLMNEKLQEGESSHCARL